MQYILLLIIIYISFISLGLPDAVLGSALPAIHKSLNIPLSVAGVVAMIISAGTIVSSFFSDKIIKKFSVAKIVAYSTTLTAIAMFGFASSSSFLALCLWAIPYGLGAGSIDAALNNYVAINYEAKHMNWLHCCWGVGAATGPIIMGQILSFGLGWEKGYFTIGILQSILTLILFASTKLWTQNKNNNSEHPISNKPKSEIIKIAGVKEVLITFFCYCALETSCGLWAASYMTQICGFSIGKAATFASMFYIGITIGRFLSGFISIKLTNKNLINLGMALIILGILLLVISRNNIATIIGLCSIGLGCAPIYPALIHSTPTNFGKDVSQSIIGMQMACAYVGTTFMPQVFGFLQKGIGIKFYPIFLLVIATTMLFFNQKMNKLVIK